MTPGNAIPAHVRVEQRTEALRQWNENSPILKEEMGSGEWGIITSGISYQYVKEALPDASVLKIGMVNPLPLERMAAFAKKVKKLAVVEELDPIMEEQLRAMGVHVDLGKRNWGFWANTPRAVSGRPSALPIRKIRSWRSPCPCVPRYSAPAVPTEACSMCCIN